MILQLTAAGVSQHKLNDMKLARELRSLRTTNGHKPASYLQYMRLYTAQPTNVHQENNDHSQLKAKGENAHKEADSLLQIFFSEVSHLVWVLRCK